MNRIKAKKRELIVSFFVLLFIFLGHISSAQNFYIYHFSKHLNCQPVDAYFLFSSFVNTVVLKPNKSSFDDLSKISLHSEGSKIDRINDSLFNVTLNTSDTVTKIYIVNTVTNSRIDSINSNIISDPFLFTINQKNHPLFYTRLIIEDMSFLKLDKIRRGCPIYENDFKISSYYLTLKRGDSVIVKSRFMGDNVISRRFKKTLLKHGIKGDGLFATDIVIMGIDGQLKTIDEVGLLRFN